MNDIEIKQLIITDLDQLQRISRQTFSETFNSCNTEANMRKYLDEDFSAEKLSTELRDKNALFFFAMHSNRVIGYLKINFGPAQTESQEEEGIEVERLYVLSEFYGKGVGQLLLDKSKEIALQKSADYLWLGVWEHNARAISFYKKNGFIEFGKHIFMLGDDEQIDKLMKLKL